MVRALGTIGCQDVTASEAELLADYYEDHSGKAEKPQTVNYYKLCDAIEVVYAEGNPEQLNSASSPGSTMMSTFRPHSIQDEEEVMHVLHRVATLCSTRRVDLRTCFIDFANAAVPHPSRPNPRRGGKVTPAQFKRHFPFIKDFGENEMTLIMDRYKTKTGDIHFQALHNDVSSILQTGEQPFPTSPLVLRADDTEWSQDALTPVQKLQSKCVEKRVRLYEQFQDFDALRKGTCTVGQVKTVLTLTNLGKEITKQDFDKLCYTFMRDDGLFNYAAFCTEIEMGFTCPGLEKMPQSVVSMPDASTTSPARRNNICLTAERRSICNQIEDRIRTFVCRRRVLIKPMFQDMDKTNRGFITRNQFSRAMTSLGFALTEIEIGILSSFYCNLGNHLDFNYVDFVKSVDPPDAEQEIAMMQMSGPFVDFSPKQYFDDIGRVQRAC
jgi:Ca2+-binding EF-hand superfamily protein